MIDAQVQVDIHEHQSDKQPPQGHSHHDDQLKSAKPQLTSGGIGHDQDDTMEDMDNEPMHLDNFDDSDHFTEDNPVDKSPGNKRASLRNRDKKKYNLNSSDSEVHDSGNDDTDDYKPKMKKNRRQAKTKVRSNRLRRCRDQTKEKDEPKLSDEEEGEQQQIGEDDGDGEYDPGPGETICRRTKIARLVNSEKLNIHKKWELVGD